MKGVYTRLEIMSWAARRQYFAKKGQFYRRIFEQSIELADFPILKEDGEDSRSICLEPFNTPLSGEPVTKAHVAVKVKCGQGHMFGSSCVWRWRKEYSDDSMNRGCLLCRHSIERPNSTWDEAQNWLQSHIELRRHLEMHFTHWLMKELERRVAAPIHTISRREWIYQLVETIAGLEVTENDRDIAESIQRARILLQGLLSRAEHSSWPSDITEGRRKRIKQYAEQKDKKQSL
jgi:hypothetical protein